MTAFPEVLLTGGVPPVTTRAAWEIYGDSLALRLLSSLIFFQILIELLGLVIISYFNGSFFRSRLSLMP